MPAPAVIPAPIVYFKVVAVKTLVVYLKGTNSDSVFSTLTGFVKILDKVSRCLLGSLLAPTLRTLNRVSLDGVSLLLVS